MKKIKLVALVIISSLFIFSCDNEPIDPTIDLSLFDDDIIIDEGETNFMDYWPAHINNQWIYKIDNVIQSPMKIILSSIINGQRYYTFNQLFGSGPASSASIVPRLKKVNGNYYIKVENFTFTSGTITGTQTGYEYIILKDFLDENETWNGTYIQTTTYTNPSIPSVTQTVTYVGRILEKNATVTVNGEEYDEVIKIRLDQQYEYSSDIPTLTVFNQYWFAKGVGLIKTVSTTNGGVTSISELDSYIIN